MKNSIFISFLLLLGFVACQQSETDTIREFIPGTYSRPIDHEFGEGTITLDIRLVNGNSYEIVKRSQVTPIRNGQKLPPKPEGVETWTGIYDEKKQVIYEQRKGKVISFVPKENTLLVGSTVYKKVKP